MKKTKGLCLFLAAAVILPALTGCGSRAEQPPEATETVAASLPTEAPREETQPAETVHEQESDTHGDQKSHLIFPEDTETYVPEAEEFYQQDRPGGHRNVGLCKTLARDAEALLVFLEDSESQWTDAEIQAYIDTMICPGLTYIEDQAAAYGYDITFDYCLYPDETGVAAPVRYNGTVHDWDDESQNDDLVDQTAAALGFADPQDMIKNVRDYAEMDQVAIIFCLDKEGRSYTRWNLDNGYFVEHTVLFTLHDGSPRAADVVPHEVMHLFGAEDLYTDRAQMAETLCPTELFYHPQPEMYDNTISPYTAYTVGWLDTVPAEFDCPEWWS